MFTHSLYVPYLRRTFILSSKEVYSDEAYTKPEFRSLGIYIYAGYLLRQKLYEMGYRRFSCVFASWNLGPLKWSEKIGLKPVGKGGYLNFLLFKKFFWKGTIKDLKDGKISVGLPDSPDSSHHGEASPDPRA